MVPILIVACREMTDGESGVSVFTSSVARSCFIRPCRGSAGGLWGAGVRACGARARVRKRAPSHLLALRALVDGLLVDVGVARVIFWREGHAL